MAIFFFRGNIISRGSGRSAVSAAAYRSGQALRSAAYRSGGDLYDGETLHDYTYRGGVVYSEIFLPDSAPPKYANRQTLWNAVETKEIRKDAQLAREVVVALQREFNLQENIEVVREYVQENFVNKGMIADVNIHDNRGGNPHAHIMLTMRHVTPDGFEKKNRDWNKRENIMSWRESWADINNRMLERKGLDDRIDHRSYKEQGIDKEPQIHMGHEAWALEKKGIKTEKGDYNREIQRRNAKREALRKEKLKEREVEKAARRVEKVWEQRDAEKSAQVMKAVEKHFKAGKAEQILEKMAIQREERLETAQRMDDLKENYFTLEKELNMLNTEHAKSKLEIQQMRCHSKKVSEQNMKNEVLQDIVEELQAERQNVHILNWKRKGELDKEIREAKRELQQAQEAFKNRFHIDSSDSAMAIKYMQAKIRAKEGEINTQSARILTIQNKQAAIELEYHTKKLLNELRPDKRQIDKLLEEMNKPPESIAEKQLHERIERRLNTITEENFQEVIEKLPDEQAKRLIKEREQAEAKVQNDRLLNIKTQVKTQTIGRYR